MEPDMILQGAARVPRIALDASVTPIFNGRILKE
jgi:hypothetical protein